MSGNALQGQGEASLVVGELQATLAGLQRRWEQLALRHLDAGSSSGRLGELVLSEARLAALASGTGLPGIDVVALAAVASWLPLQPRLPLRAVRRGWGFAAEHGPAHDAWREAMRFGEHLVLPPEASVGQSCCRSRFLGRSRSGAAELFRGPPTPKGEMSTPQRLRTPVEAAVVLGDGTLAALADRGTATGLPDVELSVYSAFGLHPVGSLSIRSVRHGLSLQRPLSATSLAARTWATGGAAMGEFQACVAALQRLVVVFSWRLGAGDGTEAGSLELRETAVEEVRWGTGGREVLRSAAFVGASSAASVAPPAAVAVLLEGSAPRSGPIIELYGWQATSTGKPAYVLRETVALAPLLLPPEPTARSPKGAAQPLAKVPYGTLHGAVALWAEAGSKVIHFAVLPELPTAPPASSVQPLQLAGSQASGASGAAGTAGSASGGNSALATFARAKQAAKSVKLRVDPVHGAGLDMEAGRWGYVVEEIASTPGQPGLAPGDCIIAIASQALHGLEDEVVHWRFGRNFADGVELTVLPSEHMCGIAKADEALATAPELAMPTPAPPEVQPAAPAAPARPQAPRELTRVELPARLEGHCVCSARRPARLLAAADNRLYVADLPQPSADEGAGSSTAVVRVLSGLVRAPHKGPLSKLVWLDGASDVLLVGLPTAVLLWRVPDLLAARAGDVVEGEPQLIATVTLPPRCTLASVALGVALSGSHPLGWLVAELSSMGVVGADSLDVWHFFTGWGPPRQQAPPARSSSSSRSALSILPQGEPGSATNSGAVSEALRAVGAALEAVAEAFGQAATEAAGTAPRAVPSNGEGLAMEQQGIAVLRAWVGKLPDQRAEALYGALDSAERALAEAVRTVRRWVRQHGSSDGSCVDVARTLTQHAEDCRRNAVWPLQAAFQNAEEAANSEGSGDEQMPPAAAAAPAAATGATVTPPA